MATFTTEEVPLYLYAGDVKIRRVRPGAVAAGAIAALGAAFVLTAVGMALESSGRLAPWFADAWAAGALIVGLFLAGTVTGRSLGPGAGFLGAAVNALLLAIVILGGAAALAESLALDPLGRLAALLDRVGVIVTPDLIPAAAAATLAAAALAAVIGAALGVPAIDREPTDPIARRAVRAPTRY